MARSVYTALIFIFLWSVSVLANDVAPVDAVARASWRPLTVDEIISPEELRGLQLTGKESVIFDARDKESYDKRHIEGAFLPLGSDFYEQSKLFKLKLIDTAPDMESELEKSTQHYPKNIPVVTYCNRGCKASAALLLKLKKLGFTDVRAMEDGIQAWEEKGYPVVGDLSNLS